MSILIKDMEMPKNCKLCKLYDNPVCCYLRDIVNIPKYTDPIVGKRHEHCPLIDAAEYYAEENKSHWIPCSKRLPKVKQKVLVQYADGSMATKRCNDAGHLQWFYSNAVAWVPAPKPYQQEGDAE